MKRFVFRLAMFGLPLLVVIAGGLFLPVTPRASKSLLGAKLQKDELLRTTAGPRLIFVGGSNLSFGLDCEIAKESLGLNPINTAVHANLGLIYMMDSSLEFVQQGDVVVVAAEYNNFYGDYAYGQAELLRTVLDVSREDIDRLSLRQWRNIIGGVPKYCLTKLRPTEYLNVQESRIYGVNSFNRYGDASGHWGMPAQEFAPQGQASGELNEAVFDALAGFGESVASRGAQMFVTFPCLQAKSFDGDEEKIRRVETELRRRGFDLLGSAERYKMEQSMMFNSPYHLIKEGAERRTRLLIEDLAGAGIDGH